MEAGTETDVERTVIAWQAVEAEANVTENRG